MDSILETSTVRRAPGAHRFERDFRSLPNPYLFEGSRKAFASFLEDTGSTGQILLREGVVGLEDYWRGNTGATRVICRFVWNFFVPALVGMAVERSRIRDGTSR